MERIYAYDAAGRMIKEGAKTYTYGWLDKVMNIADNGKITNSCHSGLAIRSCHSVLPFGLAIRSCHSGQPLR